MSRLAEKGFINDTTLAASLKRTAEDVKLLGRQGVRLFLRHRGLAEEIIKDICTDTDHEEITRAKNLWTKNSELWEIILLRRSRKNCGDSC